MDEKTIARFWSKADRRGPDECWEWKACRTTKRGGYGQFRVTLAPGKNVVLYSHRAAYEATFGAPPVGLLRHKCDNPPCCNPAHLIPGTHADNTAIAEELGVSKSTVNRAASGKRWSHVA